ncbi:hypothetical protein LIA77_06239 [Sarocladium implicatum]|nr:hypothetical protein LIA77_06239 [Sarocladium implicatum]
MSRRVPVIRRCARDSSQTTPTMDRMRNVRLLTELPPRNRSTATTWRVIHLWQGLRNYGKCAELPLAISLHCSAMIGTSQRPRRISAFDKLLTDCPFSAQGHLTAA